jgi:hypothetical protein
LSDKRKHLSDDVENLRAITEAVNDLNHIGIAIRQSAATSDISKVRRFAGTSDTTSFGGLVYLVLKNMYPEAGEDLVELLTGSMVETYTLFLYRKSQHDKGGSRPQHSRPARLDVISEESAAEVDIVQRMDLDVRQAHQGVDLLMETQASLLPPQQISKGPISSAYTSIDSKAVQARIKKMIPSMREATRSVVTNQATYSRPAEGSLICQWCFQPLDHLDGDEWQ